MAETKEQAKKIKKKAQRRSKSAIEPMDHILEALRDCNQLMDQGIITLELQYPHRVLFRVDEERFKSLENWDNEKQKKFRRLLSEEITLGLQSALSGDVIPNFAPFIDLREEREKAELITEETRKHLVTENIESLSRLKHSSKNHVIQSFDWEINTKERDRRLGQLSRMRYATVSLWHTQPGPSEPTRRIFFWPNIIDRAEAQSLTLDLHPYEIKGLINDLTKILKALEEDS